MKCEAIHLQRALYSVRKMCEALQIRQCQYYQWLSRQEKKNRRREQESQLVHQIERAFKDSYETYGCRKIKHALNAQGTYISEWKVRRIMKENGLYPVTRRKYRPYKKARQEGIYSRNEVNRGFSPDRFNQIWAGDITYIATNLGWVYLSAVLDLKNKEVIGYEVSQNIDSELCKRVLGNAIARHGTAEGLIFHSDRGSQYSSKAYRSMLRHYQIVPSMSAPGCPYDNSPVESFFATLKRELIYRKKYATIEEVRTDIFRYIELFYNRKRLHSSLGYLSPVQYRLAQNSR